MMLFHRIKCIDSRYKPGIKKSFGWVLWYVKTANQAKHDTYPHWFCCCALFPLPGIAPPSLPNCLPRPDFLATGATGAGASF